MRGKKGPRQLEKKSISNLQNTLWPLISKYVKREHSVDGWCKCITCGKALKIGERDTQCGHFISRSYSPTKYDLDNMRPQCSRCNEFYSGRPIEFERALRLEVGDERVDEMKQKSTESYKWDRFELIDLIKYYRDELNENET